MRKRSIILTSLLIACSIGSGRLSGQVPPAQLKELIEIYHVSVDSARLNFGTSLHAIQSKQQEYQAGYLRADKQGKENLRSELRTYLTERLLTDIAPAWDRTPWTFNGYSRTPGQGSIACGWFVQRIMEDLGFEFSKRRSQQPYFAQNWPIVMVEGIDRAGAERIDARQYPWETDSVFLARESGIYLIGFAYSGMDSGAHVGFMLNTGEELFILHSMGWVELVPARDESFYVISQFLYLGRLFNDEVLDCWLRDESLSW